MRFTPKFCCILWGQQLQQKCSQYWSLVGGHLFILICMNFSSSEIGTMKLEYFYLRAQRELFLTKKESSELQ